MSVDSENYDIRRRLKRRLSLWRLLAILLVIVLGVWIFNEMSEEEVRDHIARLDVTEIIVENDRREEAIDDIIKDPSAKALIVYINSPGGSTYGSERLFKALRRVAETKPVTTVIGTVGASGGYMTALAGDRIFAGESSIVGSIGVIVQLTEISELMKKVGVSATAITSGALKGEPSPFKPISEAGRENLQEMVTATYDWFVSMVTQRRPLDETQVRALADGRVVIGLVAVKNGLIDEIGGITEAQSWLESEQQIPSGLPLRTVDYSEPKPLIARLLGEMMWKSVLSERLTLDGLLSLWQPD
ncbi:signal peptide peptidase SppA [Sneathiella sp. HT1-7]|jgi:protease-4|uniref:signal peptide peptidase SppA n=1 Tax=Sneathiella sp. HT1-7 TaxID=2887192 RepID=UPI001D158624|nr:signal peptide peptidase SppA [Sneathiella sp. HT1-7]MCC3304006.1 signal peptide peptidase SppA [Sneathiella sp. HT1-7]